MFHFIHLYSNMFQKTDEKKMKTNLMLCFKSQKQIYCYNILAAPYHSKVLNINNNKTR